MKRKKIFYWVLLALLVFVVAFALKLVYDTGTFKTIKPHFAGKVEKITLIQNQAGAEDITIDYTTGMAFIAADDRRLNRYWNKDSDIKTKQGAIFLLDLKSNEKKQIEISQNFKTDFHPHGISFFQTPDNRKLLFVVNHKSNYRQHSVEIFEFKNQALLHLQTIEDKTLMSSPNDVVAISENQFYVTNDHYFAESGFLQALENYLRLPYSYVNYYDGKKLRKIADRIIYANGINRSNDSKQIFVSSPTGRKVLVYARNSTDGTLTKTEEIFVGTGVDNIEVDPQGNLWLGCHPQMLAFVQHTKSAENKSASQVLRIKSENKTFKIEEIFLNDGKEFSGSTVGAFYEDKLLIGSVFENSFLFCTIKK